MLANQPGLNKETQETKETKEGEIDRLLAEVASKVIDLLDLPAPTPKNRGDLRLVGAPGIAPPQKTHPQPTPRTPSYTEVKQMWSDRFEKVYLSMLLDKFRGNVTAASTRAKVDRSNFLRLLRKHGLKSENYRKAA